MRINKILITGASGFIGYYLTRALTEQGREFVAASRIKRSKSGIVFFQSPELGPEADWSYALQNIDAVVHLAGLSHVDSCVYPVPQIEKNFHFVNAEGARKLAEQCAEAGVKHFIFLSSCHAVSAVSDEIISAETKPQPSSAYGRSKLAAEHLIASVLLNTKCALTILRPPLVYGPGKIANFSFLLKIVKIGIPLPLGSIRNRRSFIYVENLVDLIISCLGNPCAFGKTFTPSDMEDVSTPELIRKIIQAEQILDGETWSSDLKNNLIPQKRILKKTDYARIFEFPESILKALGKLPGLGKLKKITSSLYVDSEPVFQSLGWKPPFKLEEGLRRTFINAN